MRLRDGKGSAIEAGSTGGDILFDVTVLPHPDRLPMALQISILSPRGDTLLTCNMARQLGEHAPVDKPTIITCALRNCRLAPGQYPLRLALKCQGHVEDTILAI